MGYVWGTWVGLGSAAFACDDMQFEGAVMEMLRRAEEEVECGWPADFMGREQPLADKLGDMLGEVPGLETL